MQIDFKKCTLVVKDGTATPLTTTVVFGDGMFSWTRRSPRKYTLDRGLVATGTVRNDDEQPLEVSITGLYSFLISDTGDPVTLYEAVHQEGAASAWVTTSSDLCEPYSVNLELTYDPACGSIKDEKYVFPYFRVEECTPDIKAGTIVLRGKCKVTKPTITRV